MATGKREQRKPSRFLDHLLQLGFTNRLGLYIVIFLAIGLAGGFYLAIKSIQTGYTGSLMCWTIVFTPIGTACSVVLSRIVDKNRDENTSADGEGIIFARARAQNFRTEESCADNSPPI